MNIKAFTIEGAKVPFAGHFLQSILFFMRLTFKGGNHKTRLAMTKSDRNVTFFITMCVNTCSQPIRLSV